MEAFDRFVCPLFARVSSNASEARTTSALRDLLLPKLVSGEIRVKHAEKIVEQIR
jgi:type I restriction enzyme S subunit